MRYDFVSKHSRATACSRPEAKRVIMADRMDEPREAVIVQWRQAWTVLKARPQIPGAIESEPDSGYNRIESQISWYDSKSGSAQWWFKRVKALEFISSALVPCTAFLNVYVTAGLGVFAVVLEGLQQLNQWQHNWITYRSTCEALRHEKYSYLERSGPYERLTNEEARKALVERVEALVSTEHSKWIAFQESEIAKERARLALATTSSSSSIMKTEK